MNERVDEGAMQQFDDGILRAYLDGDAVLDERLRAHIATALADDYALATRLAALRADAEAVDAAFAAFPAEEPDAALVQRAYRRIQTRLTIEPHSSIFSKIKEQFGPMTSPYRAARRRRLVFGGTLAAVALILVLVFAPVGNIVSAALDKFRYQPTQFAAITVKASDFPQFSASGTPGANRTKPTGTKPAGTTTSAQDQQKAMQELAKYVTINSSIGQGQLPGRQVKSAAEAQAVVGRAVTVPGTLPPGVPNTPQYYVSDAQTVDATLHLNEIRPVLTQLGMASLVPASGDSATIHAAIPAASIVGYGLNPTAQGAAAQNQKGVAVIALGTPTVDFQGLDVQGIAATIAALPNISPELAAQLKKADLQHTLIIPVSDQQNVKNGTINGAPNTTISQKDNSMTVVLMSKNNMLYAVIGTYGPDIVEQVAKSLPLK